MVFFFYGSNVYALRRQVRQMIDAYAAKTGSDFGLERVDGAAVKAAELKGILTAAPFLSSSRLVIVEGLSANKAFGAAEVGALLETVPATTVAVFVDPAIDKRTAVFKALSKADKVVSYDKLSGLKLTQWCMEETRRLGGEMDMAAARVLVDMAGEDQWRLSEEIAKLVNYAAEARVTAEMVCELVEPGVDQSVFEMVEAMSSGRQEAALAGYRRLLAARQSEMYVLTMIHWQLRNLLFAKAAPAGMDKAGLAREAGLSPYVAEKSLAAARRHELAALSRAYVAAAECELAIKSGRLKGEEAVEQLIRRVAQQAGL